MLTIKKKYEKGILKLQAECSAVHPRVQSELGSAPFSRRLFTILIDPLKHATSRTCFPIQLAKEISAP